jgi:serine/threonine protein kinase
VLESVDGQSFHDSFRGKPTSEDQTRLYADTLLDALQYLHSRNIIYRDLKPHNIINEPSRRLVLLDFGAAKQGYLHTTAGTLVGSNGWSAPEQFTTGEVTEASDIYGLGTTLFFILTGKEPRTYMRHDGSLEKGPRDLNSSVSREFSEVILRAVQSDPRLRPQTADDMRKVLRGTYAQLGVPNIVVSGRRYEVRTALEIGRAHNCKVRGCPMKRPLDVPIDDPQKYVGSHQARVAIDRSGRVWVEDMSAVNRIGIKRQGQGWHVVPIRSRYELQDKDIVALVYADGRGPYITFTYNAS